METRIYHFPSILSQSWPKKNSFCALPAPTSSDIESSTEDIGISCFPHRFQQVWPLFLFTLSRKEKGEARGKQKNVLLLRCLLCLHPLALLFFLFVMVFWPIPSRRMGSKKRSSTGVHLNAARAVFVRVGVCRLFIYVGMVKNG